MNFFFFFLGGGGGFGHFSITHNVSFIKIICISMPHRLNVFFLAFFMKLHFLALKNEEKIL